MSKRKIHVIYNPELNKQELYFEAKQEIKKIYEELKESYFTKNENDEMLKIFIELDKKDSYFRLLFLLSMYCTYFHKIKHKINVKKLNSLNNLTDLNQECFKKHNFVILDINDSHKILLQDLATFFNTDATNLEPITGKILYDLNQIDVQLIRDFK